MKILSLAANDDEVLAASAAETLSLSNDADPLLVDLNGIKRIDLHFPKFTDGRAYSQAFLLRRRRDFQGEIRATGDVLPDQLALMQRTGFDAAVLRADQDAQLAQRVFQSYPGYQTACYQGDAVDFAPHFVQLPSDQTTA